MKRLLVIGITGKMGVGKSTVCSILKEKGAYIIDADAVVEKLYEPGKPGARKIESFFGPDFLLKNRAVNKKKLGKFVFHNEKKLKILNNIIHPLVFSEIKKEIDKNRSQKIIVIEAMDFSEKYLRNLVDKLILVSAPTNLIKKRLIEKSLTEKSLNDRKVTEKSLTEKRFIKKKPDNKKLSRNNLTEIKSDMKDFASITLEKIHSFQKNPDNYDYLIENNGNFKNLETEVEKLDLHLRDS